MKRAITLLAFVGAILLLIPGDILARGGGGGGRGGGGGGGGRGGGGGGASAGAGRSPAIQGGGTGARPAARPAGGAGAATRPGGAGAGGAAGARPSAGQVNNFLDVPAAGGGARPGAGGAAGEFLQGGGGAGAAQLPAGARTGSRGCWPRWRCCGCGRRGGARPRIWLATVLPASRTGKSCRATVNSGATRSAIRSPRTTLVWTSGATTPAGHHGDLAPYRWATWAALGGWIGYGAGEPTTFDYGENVYYEDDQVYYDNQPVATADEYAEQADAIAASAPQTKPESSEWLPLGVFALTQDGQASGVEPTIFMQIAISKEGVIAGTLKNMATGDTQTLEGMADKKSQRVAWSVAGQQRPIIETGISSLTQDSAPALIHFADGQTQQWLLVRLPEPKQG